jgi:hypothetical protein
MKKWKVGMPIVAAIAMVTAMVLFFGGCQSPSTTSTTSTTPAATTAAASPSQTAGTPAATDTVTITPTTPSPTPEATKTPSKPDVQPYTLSKGRRDPFVPFGGGGEVGKPVVAPTTAATPTPGATKPIAAPVSPGVGPGAGPDITSIPVQVTGTFVSGGKNFAILTSEGGAVGKGGSPSFVVSTGDKVGEYKVKSISQNSVVLIWSGKEYTLKIKTFGPNSNPTKQSQTSKGEEPKDKSLPAPEKPKTAPGGGEPPPPEGGGAPGGEGKKSK